MAIDTTVPRTRRALLAGGVGGLAALLASALGRPLPARAGSDGDVVLGATNPSASTTVITNTTTMVPAFRGDCTKGDGIVGWTAGDGKAGMRGIAEGETGFGVRGLNVETSSEGILGGKNVGVAGGSFSGSGVHGESSIGQGVYGTSSSGHGLFARSGASAQAAAAARSDGGSTGLLGYSGGYYDALPTAPAKTGLYGYAAQDASARGVYGRSTAGRGVHGQATSGVGVFGYVTHGTAVRAISDHGLALRTSGRIKAEQVSGVTTIAAGTTFTDVVLGVDVTSTSFVLLTPRGNLGGRSLWYTVDTVNDRITVRISSKMTVDLKVGWLLLG